MSLSALKSLPKKIRRKLLDAFFQDDHDGHFESGLIHNMKDFLELNSLHNWLPYVAYDPEMKIFHNQYSKGIILQSDPIVGASDSDVSALYNFLQTTLPEGVIGQILLCASPFVGPELDAYILERSSSDLLFYSQASKRADFIKSAAKRSVFSHESNLIRDFRVYWTLIFDNELNLSDSAIDQLRSALIGTLSGIGVGCANVEPSEFLKVVAGLLRPNEDIYPEKLNWNPLETLSHQLAKPEYNYKITSKRLISDDYNITTYRLKDLPNNPLQLNDMGALIGSIFNNDWRLGCPFSLSLLFHIPDQQAEANYAKIRSLRADQRAGVMGRFSPTARKDASFAQAITKQVEDKNRLLEATLQVVLYTKPEKTQQHENELYSIFNAIPYKKIELARNNMLHGPLFLSVLPLSLDLAVIDSLKKFGILNKYWASNIANMLPVVADIKGMQNRKLLLATRRGQLFFWGPFSQISANYNMIVSGVSGSGKSVVAQDLILSLIGTGAKIWTIDVGRSYKKVANFIGGEFIEFTHDAKLCLNPFSAVSDEEFQEFIGFIVPLLASMVSTNNTLSPLEYSFLEQAVIQVWSVYKSDGDITKIASWLLASEDPRAQDMGKVLFPYTMTGQYGKFFNGKSNIDFNSHLVVFELEEIANDKRLLNVVFSLLMYHVTEKMYLGDRKTKMVLMIDEAWSMLKGGSGGDIIESIARRARKYGCALAIITQSLADCFSSPAAEAAYKNSYWKLFLMQNQADIKSLMSENKLVLSPYQEKLLSSLKTMPGDYSELMILGNQQECAVGRLILDPFSKILYSTKADEFTAVMELYDRGLTMEQAVQTIAEKKYV
ncbi:MAG: type IV secretion system protein TraC [Gammaproteobacteria bacterium]